MTNLAVLATAMQAAKNHAHDDQVMLADDGELIRLQDNETIINDPLDLPEKPKHGDHRKITFTLTVPTLPRINLLKWYLRLNGIIGPLGLLYFILRSGSVSTSLLRAISSFTLTT